MNYTSRFLFITGLSILIACSSTSDSYSISEKFTQLVFKQGDDNYKCYRIPAIIKCKNNDLIAFAEARKNGCSDTGDIDLVSKRSSDNGKTWGPLKVIWDDSLNVCGNPAPIVDSKTGKLHLLITWNLGQDHERDIIAQTSVDTRRIFVLRSDDNGNNWSSPTEITSTVKDSSWTWYATGPGSGMQISRGNYEGRMVIACDHIEAESKKYYSHIIYSDDYGATWNLGGTTPKDQVNECEVAELSDGRLLLNMRNYDKHQKFRQTATSNDGGVTWTHQKHDRALIEPICQASLQTTYLKGKHLLVFSNPANQDTRSNMTLKLSDDGGSSWLAKYLITANPSAYSDLVVINEGEIGCLYETGDESPYVRIVYTHLSID